MCFAEKKKENAIHYFCNVTLGHVFAMFRRHFTHSACYSFMLCKYRQQIGEIFKKKKKNKTHTSAHTRGLMEDSLQQKNIHRTHFMSCAAKHTNVFGSFIDTFWAVICNAASATAECVSAEKLKVRRIRRLYLYSYIFDTFSRPYCCV